MERGKRQALSSFFGGTGFYIALALCVMATGIAGYFLLFHETPAAEDLSVNAAVNDVVQAEVQQIQTPDPVDPAPLPPVKEEPDPKPVAVIVPQVEPDPDAQETEAQAPALIVAPLQGETVSAFSGDELQYSETMQDWRVHDGIDISAPAGTAVVAACRGTVASAGVDSRLGTTVILSHSDGYETVYAGLQEELLVEAGDTVSAGQQLGTVGNTTLTESALGAHLHFSVVKDGQAVDPDEYLAR